VKRPLVRSATFIRSAKRFVNRNADAAISIQAALERLTEDAHDSRLRTHKLKGELAGSWACSAGYDLRIIFKFVQHEGSEAILLEAVGTHDEVY
jgi:addiction module RelE/StbE family toxin